MVKRASEGMSYPYLHDLTQNVATAYGAEELREFCDIGHEGDDVWGRLDDSRGILHLQRPPI